MQAGLSDEWRQTRRVLALLRAVLGVPNNQDFLARCSRYKELCSTWNLAAKLLSRDDLSQRFDDHVADSLTLLPFMQVAKKLGAMSYVDIGSGGGLPAIPLLLAGADLPTSLIERSERKAEFLRHTVRELGLSGIAIRAASYPHCDVPPGPRVLTARATEKPAKLDAEIVRELGQDDVYLAQRRPSVDGAAGVRCWQVEDVFTLEGLRRSELCVIGSPEQLHRFHVEPLLRRFYE